MSLLLLSEMLLRLCLVIFQDHTEHVCVALTPQNETFLPFLIIVSVEASKPDPNRPSFPPAWTLVADGGSRGQGGQSHTALWVRGR